MTIEFFIPWLPIAKQGDRSRIVKTKSGGQFVAHYTAKDVKDNADTLKLFAAKHRPDKPMVGPLHLDVMVRYPWRAGESKRRRAMGHVPKDTKPDVDNLLKQICDCLQSAGFFANDAQIAYVHVVKEWSNATGIRIIIEEMNYPPA